MQTMSECSFSHQLDMHARSLTCFAQITSSVIINFVSLTAAVPIWWQLASVQKKFHCSGLFSCIQCSLHIQEPNKFSTCSVPTHRTHLFRILNSLGRHLHVILGVISQTYHRGPLPNALEIATPWTLKHYSNSNLRVSRPPSPWGAEKAASKTPPRLHSSNSSSGSGQRLQHRIFWHGMKAYRFCVEVAFISSGSISSKAAVHSFRMYRRRLS